MDSKNSTIRKETTQDEDMRYNIKISVALPFPVVIGSVVSLCGPSLFNLGLVKEDHWAYSGRCLMVWAMVVHSTAPILLYK